MTSEHLQQSLFNMTQSAEDSPAKTYQLQAYKKVLQKKPDQVFFTNSYESYAWYDPNTSSWRTWQRSLIEGWTLFSGNFPKQGMMQNGQLYLQVLWVPAINDQGGGSLPTPTASDVEGGIAKDTQYNNGSFYRKDKKGVIHHVKLRDAVASLPTPRSRDWKGGQGDYKARGYGASLPDIVNQLPTPSAHEHKYSMSKEDHQSGTCLAAMARKDRLSAPTGKPMSLNPAFVEEMMGYPIGHTDLKH